MFEKFLKDNAVGFKKAYDFGSKHGYKAPGIVDYYVEIDSASLLESILQSARREGLKTVAVGDGSNLLIRDSFNGVLINWKRSDCNIFTDGSSRVTLKVSSGMSKSDLMDYCVEHGLSGLEFWAGIPGFVGGGVAMNAGAYDKDMKDTVKSIEIVTVDGIKNIDAKDLKLSYRKLHIPESSVITSVAFFLKKRTPQEIKAKVDEYIADREKKHPLDYPSCGSVFKNPTSERGAWSLINDLGLSGFKLGGAMVSTKHTNFIINAGGASSSDVLGLISLIKEKVKNKFDIELEEELRVI